MRYLFALLVWILCLCPALAKWTENPRVLFDTEFKENGVLAGIAEPTIKIINERLVDIQLGPVEYSDVDFGIHALVMKFQAENEGLSIQDAIKMYSDFERQWVIDNPNTIRVMADTGQVGWSGGGWPYCKGTELRAENNECANGVTMVGRISLSENSFKELNEPKFSWSKDKFGEHYEQIDVLTHEFWHVLKSPHLYCPYNIADETFKTTGFPDHDAELAECLMDPSRNSWIAGPTFNDEA